jgi:hypothetical protein
LSVSLENFSLGYFPDKATTMLLAHYGALISREHERYTELESNLFPTWHRKWSEYELLRSGPLSDLYVFDAPSGF